MEEREPSVKLNLLDFLLLLATWRKLFIVNFLVVAVVASIVALVLPVWYSATTVILPPGASTSGLPSFLSADISNVAMSFGLELPTEKIYQTILSSRTLKEHIVGRFNLRQVYNMPEDAYLENVVRAFEGHLKIITRDDLSIEVTVEDREPERAAAMASACVEELDRIFNGITSESARKNRIYIGTRLKQVQDSLASLQDSLRNFQSITGAISISDQLSALIKAAAQIKAEQLSSEVNLHVLRSSFGEEHPMVSQLALTGKELGDKYERLLSGAEGNLFLAMNQLPGLIQRYAELVRLTQIQDKLLEFVYPQYESSLILEQRESANVQTLDRAWVPKYKSRPPRKLIVLVATGVSLVLTLIYVLLREYWKGLPQKSAGDWDKVQQINRLIRRKK